MRIASYVVFFIFALLFFIYQTFPWDIAKDRILKTVSKQTRSLVQADSLEPSWVTGFVAKGLSIKTPTSKTPFKIPEVRGRAKLFSFLTGKKGVVASLPIAQGDIEADIVDATEALSVDLEIENVELALVEMLQSQAGLPLGGKLTGDVDLSLSREDPKKSEGMINLQVEGLEVLKGAKVGGFPIPELKVGNLDWKVPVTEGKMKFDKQKIQGGSIDAVLDGDIKIMKNFDRSLLNLVVKFKPSEAFLKKEPLIGTLLNNIRRARGTDGFYSYKLTGPLKRPTPRPYLGR